MDNSDENIVNPDLTKEPKFFLSKEYRAKLTEFEGPLDILLHFVKAEELDIYNIPISRITKDFLSYINFMSTLDIELAGEFLLMASELMKIKARMLIPQVIQEGEIIEEDPRLTLVKKLLEYKRFKDTSMKLQILEDEQRKKLFRKNFKNDYLETKKEADIDFSIKNVTIFNLIKAYKRSISNIRREVVHPIELLDITPENQREFLMDLIDKENEIDFVELISTMKEKLRKICVFLAVLQLALEGIVEIVIIDNDMTKFFIRRKACNEN